MKGFFDGRVTQVLLDLGPEDVLLHSGTYRDKSASQMHGVRIGRVGTTLDATTNGATAMMKDLQNWPKGNPIGIQIDVDEFSKFHHLLNAWTANQRAVACGSGPSIPYM